MVNYQHIKEFYLKNKKNIIQLIIICVLVDYSLREIFYNNKLNDNNSWKKKLNNFVAKCFYETKNPQLQKISKQLKGSQYLYGESSEINDRYRSSCLVSRWNIIHLVSHIVITFFYPKFWHLIFLTSFIYEFYEYYKFKCHDYSDIVYNVTGIFIGLKLRKMYDGN